MGTIAVSELSWLFTAGVAGGIVNALAGGATLITFPAMLAAGLTPVIANASNAVAISPGHLTAALVDRESLPRGLKDLIAPILVSAAGGLLGALLLIALPARAFVAPLPALIALATCLFAIAPYIQGWLLARRGGKAPPQIAVLGGLGIACIYGGFFGAGLGVILSAAVAFLGVQGIREIKALKNLLATSVSIAAILTFIANGVVNWSATIPMLVGAILGGFAGGHLIRWLPPTIVRWIVIVAGIAMSIFYARLYWFHPAAASAI